MLLTFSMTFSMVVTGAVSMIPGVSMIVTSLSSFLLFALQNCVADEPLGLSLKHSNPSIEFPVALFPFPVFPNRTIVRGSPKGSFKKVLNDKKNIRKTQISCTQISDKQVPLLNGKLINRRIPIGIE